MSDWLRVLDPMEQATAEMLARAAEPVFSSSDNQDMIPLAGAVPLLDEVLAPAARCLVLADEHARSADLHLEDAAAALAAWRERFAGLLARLANSPTRAV